MAHVHTTSLPCHFRDRSARAEPRHRGTVQAGGERNGGANLDSF